MPFCFLFVIQKCLGDPHAVGGRGNYAAGIACALACRIESAQGVGLIGLVALDSYG